LTQDSNSLLVDMDCLGGYESGHKSTLGVKSVKKTRISSEERLKECRMGYDSLLEPIIAIHKFLWLCQVR